MEKKYNDVVQVLMFRREKGANRDNFYAWVQNKTEVPSDWN